MIIVASDFSKRLKKLKIDIDSEVGQRLKKLDDMYQSIDDINKSIKKLESQRQQLMEDVEVMELLLMHKFNKDSRSFS